MKAAMSPSRKQSELNHLGGIEAGFTLIEVLIGLAVALVVTVAGYTVLVTADKSTRANEQAVETQQNARVAMEVLAQDIKMAGFGMIGPVGACTNAVVPSDQTPGGALGAINDTGPDSLSLVIPSLVGTTSSAVPATAGNSFNTLPISGIAAGSVISIGGAMTATVLTAASPTVLSAYIPPPVTFPAGTPVYLLSCITYSIGATAAACPGSSNPCLLRNGVPITDGIEDIQFSYACDGCRSTINSGVPDKIIDDQNGGGAFDQADFVSNSTWATPPMTPDKIRFVQVSIVARQRLLDQGLGERNNPSILTAAPLLVGDRQHTASAGYQNYRRRVLTRTVELRNVGLF
jgi:type IV pilus assembly protein PilW